MKNFNELEIITQITSDPQLGGLYHNYEHLIPELIPEYKNRSVLAWYNDGRIEQPTDYRNLKKFTGSEPKGFDVIENIHFMATKNGEFEIKEKGIRIDISFDAFHYE